jgi:hypothetical protein
LPKGEKHISNKNKSYLSEEITESPADETGAGLGSQGVLVKSLVVGSPTGDGTAAGDGRVTEEGGLLGLTEGGLGQRAHALLDRRGGLSNAEGRGGDEEGSNKDGGKLHLDNVRLVE